MSDPREFDLFRYKKLHRFAALAEECGDVEIRLLEVADHGVAHAVEGDDIGRW